MKFLLPVVSKNPVEQYNHAYSLLLIYSLLYAMPHACNKPLPHLVVENLIEKKERLWIQLFYVVFQASVSYTKESLAVFQPGHFAKQTDKNQTVDL